MKKLLSIGLLAMLAFALTEHRAHAWVNSKFMIGLNWHHQSGNTSTLWGLWRNGQVPGPEAFGGGQGGAAPGMVPPGMGYPPSGGGNFPFFPYGQAPQGAPTAPIGYYGATQGYQYAGFPQTLPSNFQTSPPPLNNAAQALNATTVSYQPNSYYQPTYYQPNYSNYYSPAYGYQTPYYWYGVR